MKEVTSKEPELEFKRTNTTNSEIAEDLELNSNIISEIGEELVELKEISEETY